MTVLHQLRELRKLDSAIDVHAGNCREEVCPLDVADRILLVLDRYPTSTEGIFKAFSVVACELSARLASDAQRWALIDHQHAATAVAIEFTIRLGISETQQKEPLQGAGSADKTS